MPEARALIMDDSSVMRKIVARALRQAGIDPLTVLEAASGSEALEMLKSQAVDLLVSDINIPSMDGIEFLRQIQAQYPALPVVIVTTESSAVFVRQAIQAGVRAYLRKPFTADQVKERVLPLLRPSADEAR